MKEAYEKISCVLLAKTKEAVKIDVGNGEVVVWIPRSLLHGATDLEVNKLNPGDEFQAMIMDWKVRELGLG